MKRSIFLPALILCGSVQAGLEGDYKLVSGPKGCPSGSLQTIVDKKNPERTLLFGSRHSWTLDLKDVSETNEVVDGGCSYVQAYEKSETGFVSKTTRSNCPSKAENGVVTEKMTLQDRKLVYEYGSRKANFKCHYKKVD